MSIIQGIKNYLAKRKEKAIQAKWDAMPDARIIDRYLDNTSWIATLIKIYDGKPNHQQIRCQATLDTYVIPQMNKRNIPLDGEYLCTK